MTEENLRLLRGFTWPVIILASALALTVMRAFGIDGVPLQLMAAWFLLVCPGMAFVALLRIEEPLARWTFAVAASLAIDSLVAGALLYLGAWSPALILAVIIGLCIVGVALQVLRLVLEDATAASPAGDPSL